MDLEPHLACVRLVSEISLASVKVCWELVVVLFGEDTLARFTLSVRMQHVLVPVTRNGRAPVHIDGLLGRC